MCFYEFISTGYSFSYLRISYNGSATYSMLSTSGPMGATDKAFYLTQQQPTVTNYDNTDVILSTSTDGGTLGGGNLTICLHYLIVDLP